MKPTSLAIFKAQQTASLTSSEVKEGAIHLATIVDDPMSITVAFESKSPTLAMIDDRVCVSYLSQVLAKYVPGYFNTQNTLSLQQCVIAAEMIIEDYPALKVSEMKLILRMAAKGKLGMGAKTWNLIDPAKIFDFVREYYELSRYEFSQKWEQLNREKANQEYEKPEPMTPERREKIQQMIKESEDRLNVKSASRNIEVSRKNKIANQKYDDDLQRVALLEIVVKIFF